MNGIWYFIAFIIGVVFGVVMVLFSAVMAKVASDGDKNISNNKEAK